MNRREALLASVGALGIATVGTKVKEISADPTSALMVLQVDVYLKPEQLAQIEAKLKEKFPDLRFVVLSKGWEIRTMPIGRYYHHERLGDYEIEACADSEEQLRERLTRRS